MFFVYNLTGLKAFLSKLDYFITYCTFMMQILDSKRRVGGHALVSHTDHFNKCPKKNYSYPMPGFSNRFINITSKS